MSRWQEISTGVKFLMCNIKRLADAQVHREIGEALVFPVRSDHVVDP